MGLVTSKDEAGRVVLAGVPKDILDYKGRDLRDTMDACLEKYMWTFTIGGREGREPPCWQAGSTSDAAPSTHPRLRVPARFQASSQHPCCATQAACS